MVRVRAATESDLSSIGEILDEWLVDPLSGGLLEGETEARVALISDWIAGTRPDCQFVVAEVEHVVGVGGLQSTGIDAELVEAGERTVEDYLRPDRQPWHRRRSSDAR